MWARLSWAGIAILTVAGCGSDDKGSSSSALCDDVRSKLGDCRIAIQGGLSCDEGATEQEKCDAQCIVDLKCTDLTDQTKQSAYLKCQIHCSGLGDDAFICDDLQAYVAATAVCDGAAQCADGSDEKNCGGSDAGTD